MPSPNANSGSVRSAETAEGGAPHEGSLKEFFVAGALFVLLAVAAINLRESFFVHEGWLFGEPSWPVWVVGHLLKGDMIFRDVCFPYGVLPTFYLTGAAALFGCTTHTLALFTALAGTLGAASAILFLRRAGLSFRMRWIVWVSIVAPALWHSAVNLPAYANLEASLIITILAVLRPTGERTKANGLLVGALMGLLNLTKFGSFVGIGLAVIALDVFCALISDRRGKGWLSHLFERVVVAELAIFFGFVAVEGPRIAVSWFVFPPDIWKDFVIFPLETIKSYKTFTGGWDVVAFFREAGWGYRIGTIGLKALVMAMVLAGAMVAIFRAWRARGLKKDAEMMILLSAIWFSAGFLFYYHHLEHIVVYSTPLMAAAAVVLSRFKSAPRLVLGVFLFVCTGGAVAGKLAFQKDGRTQVVMPNGDKLWFKEQDKAVFEQISAAVNGALKEQGSTGSGAVVVWRAIGAGWHHFMGWPSACRHGYLIAHEWIRPYEFDQTITAFKNSTVYLAKLPRDGDALKVTADRSTWRVEDWLRVPPEQQPLLMDRLSAPVRAESVRNCWLVFKVNPVKP